jgi:hypothetical protein
MIKALIYNKRNDSAILHIYPLFTADIVQLLAPIMDHPCSAQQCLL